MSNMSIIAQYCRLPCGASLDQIANGEGPESVAEVVTGYSRRDHRNTLTHRPPHTEPQAVHYHEHGEESCCPACAKGDPCEASCPDNPAMNVGTGACG